MRNIFRHQLWHFLSLGFLLGLLSILATQIPNFISGSLWGVKSIIWFWIAVAVPVVHQLYVWWVWRLELYYHSFTMVLGKKLGFGLYAVGFSILFVGRLVAIIFLAISTKGSLVSPFYSAYIIAGLITPLVVYLFYSVFRYFTIRRAYGIDHFDKRYRKEFVKGGIFQHTNNAMYVYGLLILYLPGLILLSKTALLVAVFNHIYIWVHYYTVELPDIAIMYGKTPK